MMKIELTQNQRFGRLTYVREGERKPLPSGINPRRIIVRCDCGNVKDVALTHLMGGKITSCTECFFPEGRTEEVGKMYGALIVTKELDDLILKGRRFRVVEAKCICGSVKRYRLTGLKTFKSCGCITRQIQKDKFTIHGLTKSRLYGIWQNMKNRCTNKKDISYHNYGGKGITYCKEWKNFKTFSQWALTNGYSDNLSIDRYPNTNGNYEPLNCRWANSKQQANNKTNNRMVSYKREYMTLSELCDKYNLVYSKAHKELKDLNWIVDDTVVKKCKVRKPSKLKLLNLK